MVARWTAFFLGVVALALGAATLASAQYPHVVILPLVPLRAELEGDVHVKDSAACRVPMTVGAPEGTTVFAELVNATGLSQTATLWVDFFDAAGTLLGTARADADLPPNGRAAAMTSPSQAPQGWRSYAARATATPSCAQSTCTEFAALPTTVEVSSRYACATPGLDTCTQLDVQGQVSNDTAYPQMQPRVDLFFYGDGGRLEAARAGLAVWTDASTRAAIDSLTPGGSASYASSTDGIPPSCLRVPGTTVEGVGHGARTAP